MSLGMTEMLIVTLNVMLCLMGPALVVGLFYWLHLRLKRVEEHLAAQKQEESQGGEEA